MKIFTLHTIIPNFDNKLNLGIISAASLRYILYVFFHRFTVTEAIPDITPLYIDLDFTFDVEIGKQMIANRMYNKIYI